MKKIFWLKSENPEDYIWRFKNNPITKLEETDYWHIFNSAFIFKDGIYHAIFRVEDKGGCPILITGESKDGINFKYGKPIDFHYKDGRKFEFLYAYDPRFIEVEGRYFVVFCADVNGPCIYIAETKDFKNYTMLPSGFLPFNRNGVLFPEKIKGEYLMLSRPCSFSNTSSGDIYLSYSKDLVYWGNHKFLMKHFDTGRNFWERIKIGAGPAPIKTKEGWLLIYHGVQATCNGWTYSFSVALLDLKDPSKVLYKAKRYLLTPEEDYERVGFTNNVVFPTASLVDEEGHVTIYYGCADTHVGIAFTTIEKLLKFVKKYN